MVCWCCCKTGCFCSLVGMCNFVGMEATVQPTEVSESSTAQQRTLCVNLKKEGRGFILNNHVGRDEGGLV